MVSEVIQSFATTGYKIVRVTGGVTDVHMCVLADLWNLGGIDATLEGGEVISCALLTEREIAVIPRDRDVYTGGYLETVEIKDNITLNKLFYVSFVVFGLALAAVITDIFLSIRTPGFGPGQAVGYTTIMGIAVTFLFFRTGAVWPFLTGFANIIPGNTLLADGIFFVLALSLVWWVAGQIALGYNVTKKSYQKFAAVRIGARADAERGRVAIEGTKKRR